MDAASILLVLATAGQSGWTQNSTATAPVTISAAPTGGRYGPPPATTTQQMQNWAQQAGQEQLNSATDSLRDAGNRAVDAVNSQLQQYTNPFSTSTPTNSTPAATQPAATARPRGNVAPPPWDSSALESSWSQDEPQARMVADPTRSPGMVPARTESGWSSIGPSVAAPPLLVPRLATNNPTISPPPAQPTATAAATGPAFPTASVNREPITNAAAMSGSQPPPANTGNDWSGWGDFRASQPSIGSSNQAPAANNTVSVPTITAPNSGSSMLNIPAPPDAQSAAQAGAGRQSPPPAAGFRDFWAEDNPWDQQQNSPAQPQLNAPAVTISSPPANQPRTNDNNVVVLGNRGNVATSPAAGAAASPVTISAEPASAGAANFVGNRPLENAPLITQTSLANDAGNKATATKPGEEQPPWLPLLLASLALAGSVSANFFLGWSYMDARYKYQTLVRKTADKFRRVAAAA